MERRKLRQPEPTGSVTLILQNCLLYDGVADQAAGGRHVLIEGERIMAVSERPFPSSDAVRIDVGSRFVMPGLIDAHFHAYGTHINPAQVDRTPPGLRALYARKNLEDALQRGFTTVRDAAGGDAVLASALKAGLIKGPRFFYPGLALSQTGGHGDLRGPEHWDGCACSYCGAMSVVADGPDEVRRTVREQLRGGAHHVKLFVGGGVLSLSDPLWMNQYGAEEIRVAVEEASSRRTYVMAHAHTNEAAIRCLGLGVRSIEHATLLEADGARAVVEHDAFAVPTLIISEAIKAAGPSLGLPPAALDKLKAVERSALGALDHLRSAGARIGFGTDLLGELMVRQSDEFVLRQAVCTPSEILRQATRTNAEIVQHPDDLGVIKPGALADILVVDGDPLGDIAVLAEPARLRLILRGGEVMKHTLN